MSRIRAVSRTAAPLAALALALSACGGGEELVCTMEARASVVVQAVDTAGAPVEGIRVDYRIDAGIPLVVVCHGALPCVLEWEVCGQFTITVTRAGYEPASVTVVVSGDECHVSTRMVNVTLHAIGS